MSTRTRLGLPAGQPSARDHLGAAPDAVTVGNPVVSRACRPFGGRTTPSVNRGDGSPGRRWRQHPSAVSARWGRGAHRRWTGPIGRPRRVRRTGPSTPTGTAGRLRLRPRDGLTAFRSRYSSWRPGMMNLVTTTSLGAVASVIRSVPVRKGTASAAEVVGQGHPSDGAGVAARSTNEQLASVTGARFITIMPPRSTLPVADRSVDWPIAAFGALAMAGLLLRVFGRHVRRGSLA
jgi:hypothetical protein